MDSGKGLILVFDLDQTLIGWYSDTKNNEAWSPVGMKFRLNTRALSILKEAFLAKSAGVVNTIMVLSNNTHPEEPVDVIEKKVGYKFDYVIGRNNLLRDTKNTGIKDLATVSRIVGYDVEPYKVWLIDDMPHKMVTEGVHWIHIVKQENNPFGSGFSEDPDMTDYSPLQNAINSYLRRTTPKDNTIFKGGKKHTKKQKRKQKKHRRSKNRKRK
jgi:hypothetical protein